MKTDNNQVLIVGAGMAGLTAASYLARKNFKVLLLEKNDKTGGLLGSFEKDGFFFDSGPRALVNSGIIKPILNDLGIEWEYYENKITLGIEDHLLEINTLADLKNYQRILTELYPENVKDITKIVDYIRQLSEYTRILYEFDNPNFSNQMNDKSYIFKRLLPWMVKFLHAIKKLNDFNVPMENFLSRLTSNQSLIDIITQHFFRQTPTYFALGYFHVYMDYFYPKGGTGSLNDLLREKIIESGGEIRLDAQINEVIPSERRISDSQGNNYHYDQLIWAADLKTLYQVLEPAGLDNKTVQKIETDSARILSSKGAESVFMTYLSVDRPPSYFEQNGGGHLFFTPSKQGLCETNREEREALIQNFDRLTKEDVLGWLDKYIHLNTYEISIPALRDHTLAPEGQSGVMISFLFDYQIVKKVQEAGWYDEFKDAVENRVCAVLSQTLYKDLDKDILFKFSSTPLTINKLTGSSEGAITGWSFEQTPPVISKLQEIPKSVKTPIPNVYQAGQWAYSPAGVPIAMLTGWYASQEILKYRKKK